MTAPRKQPNSDRVSGADSWRSDATDKIAPPARAMLVSAASGRNPPRCPGPGRGPPAATSPISSRYWRPWAIVIPATAAYGELKMKAGSVKPARRRR